MTNNNNMTDVNETINEPESASSVDSSPMTDAAPQHQEANSAPEAVQSQEPQIDANNSAADSSPADDKDANKKATLLDVVKAAYEKGKPDSKSSNEGEQQKVAYGEKFDDDASKDGINQKEDPNKLAEKLPFHNHPRWKEMIQERDQLKPAAEQYQKITTFMNNNGLSTQEMAEGMQVMALMKNDPIAAYAKLKGYLDNLAPVAGEILPEDIRQKVDDGFIDEETAKELARLKAEKDFHSQRFLEQQTRQERQVSEQNQRAMYESVATWEQAEKAKDPDWAAKYEMVMDRVKSLLSEKQPKNAQEAVEVARRALADVNSRLRPLAGRSTNLRSPTSSLSSANTRPAPRSLEDVVRLGLQV